jgi:tetratricopeptide (TPR) repeat protein
VTAEIGQQHSQLVFDGYLPGEVGWRLQKALCASRTGSPERARGLYQEVEEVARAKVADKSPSRPVDAAWHSALGLAQAGLGQAEAAVSSGQAAVSLIDSATDAWEGPDFEFWLAQIYATNGDAEHALALLDHLMRTRALASARASLAFDPIWDPIRKDARFQALLARHPLAEKDTTGE